MVLRGSRAARHALHISSSSWRLGFEEDHREFLLYIGFPALGFIIWLSGWFVASIYSSDDGVALIAVIGVPFVLTCVWACLIVFFED